MINLFWPYTIFHPSKGFVVLNRLAENRKLRSSAEDEPIFLLALYWKDPPRNLWMKVLPSKTGPSELFWNTRNQPKSILSRKFLGWVFSSHYITTLQCKIEIMRSTEMSFVFYGLKIRVWEFQISKKKLW